MISFFREKKMTYMQKAPSGKRGFFFMVQAGFEKKMEELSGMTVSLSLVDQWLNQAISNHLEGEMSPEELLFSIRDQLIHSAAVEETKLVSLTLQEDRNWALSWDTACALGHLCHRTTHYEEIFHEGTSDLWRVELVWIKTLVDHFDYFHESLKVLKSLPPGLKERPQKELSQTSSLVQISIESRGEGWALEI